MKTNADTLLAFNVNDADQARVFNQRMGMDTGQLTNTAKFHLWMRVTKSNGELSQPFRVYTNPRYPPVRGVERRNELIRESLREHGKPKPTEEEEMRNLLYRGGDGPWETGWGGKLVDAKQIGEDHLIEEARRGLQAAYRNGVIKTKESDEDADTADEQSGAAGGLGEGGLTAADTDPEQPDRTGVGGGTQEDQVEVLLNQKRDTLLEGIYAACLHKGVEQARESDGPFELEAADMVETDRAKTEIEARIGDTGDGESVLANALERLPDELVTRERRSGNVMIGVTAKGRSEVFQQDTGAAENAGKDDHRYVLRKCFKWFTAAGYEAWLPKQEGEEAADGMADTPISPAEEGDTYDEIQELASKLEEEYPRVWDLAGADDVSIEAETSTLRHPEQTLKNFRGVIDADRHAVFAVKDGRTADINDPSFEYWAERMEYILYEKVEGDGYRADVDHSDVFLARERDEQGLRVFYADTAKLQPGQEDGNDVYPLRRVPDKYDSADDNDFPQHQWRETPDGGVECVDSDGEIVATFDSLDGVQDLDAVKRSFPAYYYYDHGESQYVVHTETGDRKVFEEKDILKQNFATVSAPVIPDNRFKRQPEEDDFTVLIIPDDDNEDYHQPYIYDQGELVPFFDADAQGTADTEPVDTGEDEAATATEETEMPETTDATGDSSAKNAADDAADTNSTPDGAADTADGVDDQASATDAGDDTQPEADPDATQSDDTGDTDDDTDHSDAAQQTPSQAREADADATAGATAADTGDGQQGAETAAEADADDTVPTEVSQKMEQFENAERPNESDDTRDDHQGVEANPDAKERDGGPHAATQSQPATVDGDTDADPDAGTGQVATDDAGGSEPTSADGGTPTEASKRISHPAMLEAMARYGANMELLSGSQEPHWKQSDDGDTSGGSTPEADDTTRTVTEDRDEPTPEQTGTQADQTGCDSTAPTTESCDDSEQPDEAPTESSGQTTTTDSNNAPSDPPVSDGETEREPATPSDDSHNTSDETAGGEPEQTDETTDKTDKYDYF